MTYDNSPAIDKRPQSSIVGCSSVQTQSPNKTITKLEKEDFERIKEYDALPRACILKNLIKQRRNDPHTEYQRAQQNFIAQGAALYSANPINTVLDDQIEIARAHSRGKVDFDRIVRSSLYSNEQSKREHIRVKSYGDYNAPTAPSQRQKLNMHATSDQRLITNQSASQSIASSRLKISA